MQVVIDDARIDVLDSGGDGPPILLLQGFALTKNVWDPVLNQLAARARVLRCDLRGFGASSAPGGPYLVETLAGDLAALLDRLEIERAIVAGHGYSVGIALTFFRMFAERLLGLGLLAGTGGAPDATEIEELFALARAVERDGMQPLVERWLPLLFAQQTRADHPEIVLHVRAMMLASNPVGAAANLRGMGLWPGCDDILEDVDVPVCVIAGARDAFCEAASVEALHARLASSVFESVPAGHISMLEAPQEVGGALERLIARV